MKALVLSGGGARGAYEAGAALSLIESGESYDIICGTSIGAINGAFLAQGKLAELSDLWHTIGQYNVIQYVPQVKALRSIVADVEGISHDPILKRVGDLVGLLHDYQQLGAPASILRLMGAVDAVQVRAILERHLVFSQLQKTLIVTATNLSNGTSDVFYRFQAPQTPTAFSAAEPCSFPLTNANFVDVVQASTTIPGAFPPITVHRTSDEPRLYVDGGVANNTPIGQAIDAGATDVTVIFMDPPDTHTAVQSPANLAQVIMGSYGVMSQRILELDLKLASRVNELAQASEASGKQVVQLRTVRPDAPLPLSVLDFDKQPLLIQAFERGRLDGRAPVTYSGYSPRDGKKTAPPPPIPTVKAGGA